MKNLIRKNLTQMNNSQEVQIQLDAARTRRAQYQKTIDQIDVDIRRYEQQLSQPQQEVANVPNIVKEVSNLQSSVKDLTNDGAGKLADQIKTENPANTNPSSNMTGTTKPPRTKTK